MSRLFVFSRRNRFHQKYKNFVQKLFFLIVFLYKSFFVLCLKAKNLASVKFFLVDFLKGFSSFFIFVAKESFDYDKLKMWIDMDHFKVSSYRKLEKAQDEFEAEADDVYQEKVYDLLLDDNNTVELAVFKYNKNFCYKKFNLLKYRYFMLKEIDDRENDIYLDL